MVKSCWRASIAGSSDSLSQSVLLQDNISFQAFGNFQNIMKFKENWYFRGNIKNNSVGWSNIVTLTKRGKSNNFIDMEEENLSCPIVTNDPKMVSEWIVYADKFLSVFVLHYISKCIKTALCDWEAFEWKSLRFVVICCCCGGDELKVVDKNGVSVLQQNIQRAPENIVHSLCIWSCQRRRAIRSQTGS